MMQAILNVMRNTNNSLISDLIQAGEIKRHLQVMTKSSDTETAFPFLISVLIRDFVIKERLGLRLSRD